MPHQCRRASRWVGLISQYNAEKLPPGPNLGVLLTKRAFVQGVLVGDYEDRRAAFRAGVGRWLREGRLKYREDVAEGLENAPRAFLGPFEGRNFGKLPVRVSHEQSV